MPTKVLVTFIAKVKGVVLKNFLGGFAPNPLSSSPIHLLTAECDCYVHLISKRTFYNSIYFYPTFYAATLVGKKVSPAISSNELELFCRILKEAPFKGRGL